MATTAQAIASESDDALMARVVVVGNEVAKPDLTRVDEVGFADLMPGSGHGPGGYANVATFEVYGRPVTR